MDQDAAREADEAAALRAIDRERLGEHPAARAQAMARRLVARGAVSTPAVAAAFARVDRRVEIKILRRVRWRDVAKHYRAPPTHRLISTQVDRAAFAPAGHDDRAFDDAPLRATEAASGCVVHLSAPSIYAAALEALGLDEVSRWRRQLSFLNLGSGSGYLSALAAALLGEGCVHVCVELDAALAARSRATLAALGRGPVPALRDVQVVCASAFDVDVDLSMKFDRIYVGAGARHGDARRFGRLLKPDGRLVGPFEDDFEPRPPWGLPQALLRVTRPRAPEGSDEFELDDLLPVQFSNLVRPAGGGDDDDDGEYAYAYADSDSEEEDEDDEEAAAADAADDATRDAAAPAPAPAPRPAVRLVGPRWRDAPHLFGREFHVALATLRRAAGAARVPWHVVAEHVVSFLGHGDVAAAPPQPSPAALAAIAQVRASRFRAFVARSAGAAVNGIMGTLGHRTNRYHDSDHDGSDSE